MRNTLKSRTEIYGEHYYHTAMTRAVLGECLTAQKRFEEAEPLLIESYNDLKMSLGEQNLRTLAVGQQLVNLYDAWNKPDKVAPFRGMLKGTKETPPR